MTVVDNSKKNLAIKIYFRRGTAAPARRVAGMCDGWGLLSGSDSLSDSCDSSSSFPLVPNISSGSLDLLFAICEEYLGANIVGWLVISVSER